VIWLLPLPLPLPPAFACAVFLAECVLGAAAVDEGGEGGGCFCQEGNMR
jgi:hypothetical protein